MAFLSIITKKKLDEYIPLCSSKAQLLRKLGLKPCGGNYKTLGKLINTYDINIDHFKGRGWNKGLPFTNPNIIPLSQILVKNSTYTNSNTLKNRLIKENIFEYKCYNCGNTKWMGQPIPLELEHKNGDNMDNRIENITLLCPNCHALSRYYRGRNNKIKKNKNEKILITPIIKHCNTCGSRVGNRNKSGYCSDCYRKKYKISEKLCINCNKNLSIVNKMGYCSTCYKKLPKPNRRKVV